MTRTCPTIIPTVSVCQHFQLLPRLVPRRWIIHPPSQPVPLVPEDDIFPVDPSTSDPPKGNHLGSYNNEASSEDGNQFETVRVKRLICGLRYLC